MAIITRIPSHRLRLSLLSLTLVAAPCFAEETKDWQISPSLQLGLDYSDNLDLAASDQTETFFGTLTPGISINRQGRYLQLGLDYNLALVDYSSETRSDSYFHRLNAFADAELVEDHLFVNTQAGASQQLIDNRSAGNIDPRLSPDAFTNTFSFTITPSWRQRIGDYTDINLSAGYDAVIYQNGAEDSEGVSYSLSFDTRANPNKIYWTLQTRKDNAKSSNSNSTLDKNDFAQLQLGYRHSQQLDLRVGGGYSDSYIDNPTDTNIASGTSFWSAGLSWNPSPRTSLDLNYSSKLQSASRGAVLTHRRKRGTLSLSYQQSLSSVRQEQLQLAPVGSLICPAGNSINLADCRFIGLGDSAIPGSNEQVLGVIDLTTSLNEGRFINEALRASYNYSFRKSSLSLGLSSQRRKFQDLSNRVEEDLGVNAGWSLQLSARSSMDISYDWSVLEPNTNAVSLARDYRSGVNLGMNRKLSPDTALALYIRYNEQRSSDPSRQFEEYGSGASISHSF
tara:strand:+ start:489 stop:2012 length:1524 start_codon:yes stop_codon:yes gene_type:complete